MPPRPSSNHSQTSNQAPINNSNQSNQPQTIDPAVTPPARPPNASTTPTPTGMAAQGSYQTPPPQPPHMHGYKMGPSPGPPGPGPQNMPPYPPQSQQQYAQGNFKVLLEIFIGFSTHYFICIINNIDELIVLFWLIEPKKNLNFENDQHERTDNLQIEFHLKLFE